MLKQTIIAAAAAIAMGASAAVVTATPASADNFGFYFSDRGVGVNGGSGPDRRHHPPPRYKRYSDSGCWAWSKRLHQRVWVCGPPHRYPYGPSYGGGPRHHHYD
jgi:hypothetical protein